MQAVVVGGSGFIGSALVRELVGRGASVVAVDRQAPLSLPAAAEFQQLDIAATPLSIRPATDVVYYLAQSPNYRAAAEHRAELFDVNTAAAISAHKASAAASARVFVYASSGNVYAPSFLPLAENAPLDHDEPYALSKILVEDWLSFSNPPLASTAVRLFGVFGPEQRDMLPLTLRGCVERREPIVIERNPGDADDLGGLQISFCPIQDAVAALQRLAERQLSGNRTPPCMNIAGLEPISVRRFADAVGRQLGIDPVYDVSSATRNRDLIADTTLMRATLDIDWTSFEAAITQWLNRVPRGSL